MNTTYYKNLVAGNLFNLAGADAVPAKYYLGLSSSRPADDGTGYQEPGADASGYVRIELTGLGGLTGGAVSNTAELSFPKSLTDWYPASAPATHFTIFDGAGADARLLIYGELTKPRIVQSDSYLKLPAGELHITVV